MAKRLKGTGIYINDDFSFETSEIRNELLKTAKELCFNKLYLQIQENALCLSSDFHVECVEMYAFQAYQNGNFEGVKIKGGPINYISPKLFSPKVKNKRKRY